MKITSCFVHSEPNAVFALSMENHVWLIKTHAHKKYMREEIKYVQALI